jgi:hypothetical protein
MSSDSPRPYQLSDSVTLVSFGETRGDSWKDRDVNGFR